MPKFAFSLSVEDAAELAVAREKTEMSLADFLRRLLQWSEIIGDLDTARRLGNEIVIRDPKKGKEIIINHRLPPIK